MSGVQRGYGYPYIAVAASQTGTLLGQNGQPGDYVHRLVISVQTAATATVTLIDGSTSIPVLVGGATVVPGVYSIEMNMASINGGWSLTTGAGATVIAVGLFTP